MTAAAEARGLLEGCRELYLGHHPARDAELPPHDLEAETVVLSAVLWGDRQASELRLRPAWLWYPDNRYTWAVLLAMEGAQLSAAAQLAAAIRILPRIGHGPAWYWHRLLCRIMGYTGDPEECARIIRDRARERALLDRMMRIERDLRAGEPPSWELVHGTVAGLLRMRAGHRRRELLEALDCSVGR